MGRHQVITRSSAYLLGDGFSHLVVDLVHIKQLFCTLFVSTNAIHSSSSNSSMPLVTAVDINGENVVVIIIQVAHHFQSKVLAGVKKI